MIDFGTSGLIVGCLLVLLVLLDTREAVVYLGTDKKGFGMSTKGYVVANSMASASTASSTHLNGNCSSNGSSSLVRTAIPLANNTSTPKKISTQTLVGGTTLIEGGGPSSQGNILGIRVNYTRTPKSSHSLEKASSLHNTTVSPPSPNLGDQSIDLFADTHLSSISSPAETSVLASDGISASVESFQLSPPKKIRSKVVKIGTPVPSNTDNSTNESTVVLNPPPDLRVLKSKVVMGEIDPSLLTRISLLTLLSLASWLSNKINTDFKNNREHLSKKFKGQLATLINNQEIIVQAVNHSVNHLIARDFPSETTTITQSGPGFIEQPPAIGVSDSEATVLATIVKENIAIRKEIAQLEALVEPDFRGRDMKNANGIWGREFNFRSNVNCCSATALIRNFDHARKAEVMKFCHSLPRVFPSWRSNVIAIDSICTCRGTSSSCPVISAVDQINLKFPETSARFTTSFSPRIRVQLDGRTDDHEAAWEMMKECFPSNSLELGVCPKLIAKWSGFNTSNFVFEVNYQIRHLIAGKSARVRSSNVVIKDSIYIPFCKSCHKLGHSAQRCNDPRDQASQSSHPSRYCLSCPRPDHHPLHFNCPTRDKIIRSKLSRIDYGPHFRHKITIFQ